MGRLPNIELRRRARREELWPHSDKEIWWTENGPGWCPLPRTIPLILALLQEKKLVGAVDCGSVYLELLARNFGSGLIEVQDETDHAFHAGYVSSRGRRTWQERIAKLNELGFIRTKEKPGQKRVGYILLVNPHVVLARLRKERKISDAWWDAYETRQHEVGARVETLKADDGKRTPAKVVPLSARFDLGRKSSKKSE